jgi:hypothetical protein
VVLSLQLASLAEKGQTLGAIALVALVPAGALAAYVAGTAYVASEASFGQRLRREGRGQFLGRAYTSMRTLGNWEDADKAIRVLVVAGPGRLELWQRRGREPVATGAWSDITSMDIEVRQVGAYKPHPCIVVKAGSQQTALLPIGNRPLPSMPDPLGAGRAPRLAPRRLDGRTRADNPTGS